MTDTTTAGAPRCPPGEHASAGLARVLGPGAAVLLVLSCITPASSLFIIVPELLASQGSGAVLTMLAGVVVSIAVGCCYAELGHPHRQLRRRVRDGRRRRSAGRSGWLTFALAGVLLFVIPPIIALGTADYLADLVTVPRGAAAAVVMLARHRRRACSTSRRTRSSPASSWRSRWWPRSS